MQNVLSIKLLAKKKQSKHNSLTYKPTLQQIIQEALRPDPPPQKNEMFAFFLFCLLPYMEFSHRLCYFRNCYPFPCKYRSKKNFNLLAGLLCKIR